MRPLLTACVLIAACLPCVPLAVAQCPGGVCSAFDRPARKPKNPVYVSAPPRGTVCASGNCSAPRFKLFRRR